MAFSGVLFSKLGQRLPKARVRLMLTDPAQLQRVYMAA